MVPEVGKTSHFYLRLGVFLDVLVMLVDNIVLHQIASLALTVALRMCVNAFFVLRQNGRIAHFASLYSLETVTFFCLSNSPEF